MAEPQVGVEEKSTVDDHDVLLRRVPKRPSCLASDNAGGYVLKPEAFQYDHGDKANGHPGLSVSLQSAWEGLATANEQSPPAKEAWSATLSSRIDWDELGIAAFKAATVRKPIAVQVEPGVSREIIAGDVYRDPVDDDEGHALVRINADENNKKQRRMYWLPLRSRLREAARFYDTPSEVPTLAST